jgi:hypothetical protein
MEASVRLVRRCLRGSAGLISGLISSFGRLGTSRNGVRLALLGWNGQKARRMAPSVSFAIVSLCVV